MRARTLEKLREELAGFLGKVAGSLGRWERHRWAETYVRGLLLDGERKSIEPMAARLKAIDQGQEDYEQALQQFVSQSPWDEQEVRRQLALYIGQQVGWEGTLIVDDSGFPKQGKDSVAVARQYSGTLGKVANCQVAVTLQFVGRGQVYALDADLYLPQAWCQDAERRKRAGVPEEVAFQPKWKLALGQLARAKANGFCGLVCADSAFGDVTAFRQELEEEGWSYTVGISSHLVVIAAESDLGEVPPAGGKGRPPSRPPSRPAAVREGIKALSVKEYAKEHAKAFRKVTWREGTKGKLASRFAALRVRPAHRLSAGKTPLPALWLLVEWPEGQAEPAKYYFSNLPEGTSLKRLVQAAKSRWYVEHSYKEMKDELGLDHFEGRFWRGWHHHVTLVMLAYAFLQLHRRGRPKKRGRPLGLSPPSDANFNNCSCCGGAIARSVALVTNTTASMREVDDLTK